MIHSIVAVKDLAIQGYGRPIFVPTTAVAIRSFRDEVNSSKDQDVSRHPDDFELYEIGKFDDSDGSIIVDVPRLLARAKDLKDA